MNAFIAQCIAAATTGALCFGAGYYLGNERGYDRGDTHGRSEQRAADDDTIKAVDAASTARLARQAEQAKEIGDEQSKRLEASRSATQTLADTWMVRAQLLDKRLSGATRAPGATAGSAGVPGAACGPGNGAQSGGAGPGNGGTGRYLTQCVAALIPVNKQLADLLTADGIWRERDAELRLLCGP